MTPAIIGALFALLAALAPVLGKMVGAWWAKKQSADASGETKRNEIAKAIKDGDEDAVNRLLNDATRGVRPPDTGGGDPKRPGGDKAPGQ